MSDLNPETIALIRHHAKYIEAWRITTCDPMAKNGELVNLRESAQRLLALVLEVAPAPEIAVKRKPTSKKRRWGLRER
jgi:hypothetical protein